MKSRIGRNAVWLLVARLGTQGLLAVFTIIVARRLGETGLGQYAFVASVIFVANSLTTFGTDMLLIREIAAGSGLGQLAAALLLQLALSVGCVVCVMAVSPWLPNVNSATQTALRIYCWALLPLAFYTVFTTALRGLQQMSWYSVLNLAVSLLQTLGAGIFVQAGSSVVTVAWVLLVVQLAAAVLAAGVCRLVVPTIYESQNVAWSSVADLMKRSMPLAWMSVLGMLYQRASVYQLTTLAGAAVTGGFSAAARIVEASKAGHVAMFGAVYPAMAQKRSQGELRTSGWLLLAGAAIGSMSMFLLAEPIIPVLFGDGFDSSITALRILAWQLIPFTVSAYLSLALIAFGYERLAGRALGVSVIVLIGLTTWWAPVFGLAGACWAAVVAESVQAACLLFLHRKVTL
jgi:PST family polysaccharide transporter